MSGHFVPGGFGSSSGHFVGAFRGILYLADMVSDVASHTPVSQSALFDYGSIDIGDAPCPAVVVGGSIHTTVASLDAMDWLLGFPESIHAPDRQGVVGHGLDGSADGSDSECCMDGLMGLGTPSWSPLPG